MEGSEANKHRNWLERIQERSWEPEILISGIVLFALFQIPPHIRAAANYLDVHSVGVFSQGNADELLGALLLSANYWLIAGFTVHLMGRSTWAAFIGLSYVYDRGIKVEEIKYHKRYNRIILRNVDYKVLIVKIEKFCSRIFAVSFLLFMCTVGVFFFLAVLGTVISALLYFYPNSITAMQYLDPVLVAIGSVYLFDFVTLGLIKRIPFVNKLYYPLYRLMSVLTLAPLYRNIYYGFVSNHKSWKVGLAMLVFATITMFMVLGIRKEENFLNALEFEITSGKDIIFPGHYRNLAQGEPSKRIIIESDIIDKNVLKVFLVQTAEFEERHIAKHCNFAEKSEIEGINLDSLKMECLTSFYVLSLDGDTLAPNYFVAEDLEYNRRGLVTYVDISHLTMGEHHIELFYRLFRDDGSTYPGRAGDVEFYKTLPARREILEKTQVDTITGSK